MIDAVAEAIARVLRLLLKDQKPEEAQQVLAESYRSLSLDREFLLVLDGPSIRTHCGNDDERLALAVRLLLSDCEVQVYKADRREASRALKAARRALAEVSDKPADLSAELARLTEVVAAL
ncbi:MAG TPA: hypothetical protein VMF89_15755 [Polyangiales bacterium]|nr:hypothetical protein [Polyangiales bacterium]